MVELYLANPGEGIASHESGLPDSSICLSRCWPPYPLKVRIDIVGSVQ